MSPLLLKALTTNQTLPAVQIGLNQGGQQLATIKLTNANLATYDLHGTTETWVDGGVTAEDDWLAPVS